MTRTGRLITIEGIDGTGKTTLAEHLRGALAARGVAVELHARAGWCDGVRAHPRSGDRRGAHVAPRTEALLYAAARAQLVEEAIRPALASRQWVLLDRFLDSSLAYQGGGRRLGVEPIRDLNLFATAGLEADRTLLLALDAASCPGPPGLKIRGRLTDWNANRMSSSASSPTPTLRWRPPTPTGSACSMPPEPREQVLAERSTRSAICCSGCHAFQGFPRGPQEPGSVTGSGPFVQSRNRPNSQEYVRRCRNRSRFWESTINKASGDARRPSCRGG